MRLSVVLNLARAVIPYPSKAPRKSERNTKEAYRAKTRPADGKSS